MSRLVELEESGVTMKLQIWDTAGQEKYRSITPIYYRDAAAAICVFDVTSKQSLDDAEKWIEDLRQYAPPDTIIALAGNKCDLYNQEEVSIEEGREFQARYQIEVFQQTSAKENTGIEELFMKIALKIDKNKEQIRINIGKANPKGSVTSLQTGGGKPGRCKC